MTVSWHSRLSASSAHRWMKCAGSPGESSPANYPAAEGTHAHNIAAACMTRRVRAQTFLGFEDTIDGHKIVCDQEMVDYVQWYVDACMEDVGMGDEWWSEMSLHDELQTVDPDFGGTADFVRLRPRVGELLVRDLKYGKGVFVSVTNNVQTRMYALGALLKLSRMGYRIRKIRVSIAQPRYKGCAPIREEVFAAATLLDFAADMTAAAVKTRAPSPELRAGEHCLFCPKEKTCPERNKSNVASASMFSAAPAVATIKLF